MIQKVLQFIGKRETLVVGHHLGGTVTFDGFTLDPVDTFFIKEYIFFLRTIFEGDHPL